MMPMSALLLLLYLIPSDSLENAVIAKVGRFEISGKDLLESYEFGPAFVKREPDPLRKHLQYMIYERLLALEAERAHADTTRFVRDRLAALEEDLSVEELYKTEILSKVKVSDEETEWGFQKAKTNLRLRWIYLTDEKAAARTHDMLVHGVSFDSLFSNQAFMDSSANSRTMETSVLTLEHDNPAFARNLQHLKSREITPPIKGVDGYYIIRIDAVWQNPLTTETEYATLKVRAGEVIRQMKADKLADAFVGEQMKAAHPVIKAEGFNIVRALLAEKGLSRNARIEWKIPATFMTEAGPQPISASGKFLNKPLVAFNHKMFTAGDYAKWFDIRQFQLKTNSLAAFNASVRQTIWKMVQDKILSDEAYSRRLNMQDVVRKETTKWEAKLLYLAERQNIRHSVSISDSSLREEYEKQKRRFHSTTEKLPTFSEAKMDVWQDLFAREEVNKQFRILQRLEKEIPVVVHEEIVQKLSSAVEKDVNPIDVMYYKPGGTYPRIAFPTIDASWRGSK